MAMLCSAEHDFSNHNDTVSTDRGFVFFIPLSSRILFIIHCFSVFVCASCCFFGTRFSIVQHQKCSSARWVSWSKIWKALHSLPTTLSLSNMATHMKQQSGRQGNLECRAAARVSAWVTGCTFSHLHSLRTWAHELSIVRSWILATRVRPACSHSQTDHVWSLPIRFDHRPNILKCKAAARGTPLLNLIYLSNERLLRDEHCAASLTVP